MELNRIVKKDGRCKADLKCIQHVRYLELVNITDDSEWLDQKRLPKIINTCLSFPKLKSLTFAYDSLSPFIELTLAKYLEPLHLGKMHCLDIGIFKLGDNEQKKIFFKHYGIIEGWQKVKTAGVINVKRRLDDYLAYSPGFRNNTWHFLSCVDLPTWCAIYDRMHKNKGISSDHRIQDLLDDFSEMLTRGDVPRFHPKLDAKLKLRDLDGEKHGVEVVQWLSDLLFAVQYDFRKAIRLNGE